MLSGAGLAARGVPRMPAPQIACPLQRGHEAVQLAAADWAPPVSARATQVVDWMPQNDVLGHARTRVFLSQCGANSLYEARSCASCVTACRLAAVTSSW